jgi:serine phosphatase RsbU (regulator of sigma subunit)
MRLFEHLRCYCRFWQPSLARRITFYFMVFGLVVFIVTAFLYTFSSRKHFAQATVQLVRSLVQQIDGSTEPDFMWRKVDSPLPDLSRLIRMLAGFSASFYSVSDISLFAKSAESGTWYRLYFDESRTLRKSEAMDDALKKLKFHEPPQFMRSLMEHFRSESGGEEILGGAMPILFRSKEDFSMFVDITGRLDANQYVMRLTAGSEGMGAMMAKQPGSFVGFLIVVLLISRFLGYYFARRISRPIEEISALASAVARGDLTRHSATASPDEVGSLARSFNTMIDGLRDWQRIKLLEFEMEKGREIQQDFLPRELPQLHNWEIAACFHPAGQVSGDFYDAFMLPDGTLGLVIADVCDKGVGSALYMALFRSLIRVFAQQTSGRPDSETDPGTGGFDPLNGLKAVSFTNDYIARNHDQECMFATMFFGVLDPRSGVLNYINAGHEPLFIKNKSGIKDVISRTGPAVGMVPDSEYRIGRARLEQGDILVGYTDGVTDARSPADELFTRSRLTTLLAQPLFSAGELVERVITSLFAFIDVAPRLDDITLLAVQRTGADLPG